MQPLEIKAKVKPIKKFINELKEFAVKGSFVELAVGVVIGAAFKSVVDSIVNDIILPPIGFITGRVDFSNLYISLSNKSYASLTAAESAGAPVIRYGSLISSLINFCIISLVLFFIVKWSNRLQSLRNNEAKEKQKTSRKCKYCRMEVSRKATRCPYCTSDLNLV